MELIAVVVTLLLNNFIWMIFYQLKGKDKDFISEVKRVVPNVIGEKKEKKVTVDTYNNDRKYKPVFNLTKQEASKALNELLKT